MKKKIVTSALAIASAAVLTLSFAGCKKEESISKADFVNGAYSSYATYMENFNAAQKDPSTYSGLSLTANSTSEMSYKGEWEYTPSGASAPTTQEYTATVNSTLSLKVDIKAIDGVMHLFVNAVEKESATSYSVVDSNSPMVAKKSVGETSTTWEFGKSGELFFARTAETEKVGESTEGEPTLGDPTTTKEYTTYSNEGSYYSAISSLLDRYNQAYALAPFNLLESSSDYDSIEYFKAKNSNTYKAVISATQLMIDSYYPDESGKYSTSATVVFGAEGVSSVDTTTKATMPMRSMSMSSNYQIAYSSDAAAVSDPFDGYTENYLSVNNAFFYPSSMY